MRGDGVTSQQDDFDTDSLFGSPPPSPGRGRSPSPLALPSGEDSTQNVGTLALPGSHLCSEFDELPSVPPSVPVKRSVAQRSLLEARSMSATPQPSASKPRSTPVPRKAKRASRRSTPAVDVRPTPPPIKLPSPTDPPPANFLRNQQALLGLAGLVGGVNPANLSVQRHTRGETPNNPIVVEEVPDTPKIGRWPVPSFVPGPLPTPSTREVMSTLVKQKNLYPIVHALLRLVSNVSGAPATVPAVYPTVVPPPGPVAGPSCATPYRSAYEYAYHPYHYGYPYHYPYPYSYSTPYAHTSYPFVMPAAAPPPKKRKLTDVPAGAVDWDVPYPFAAGQGPPGYHANWARQRQQQLLEDLVGLVKSASQKAAAKKAKDETSKEAAIGSVEYYKERVLKHCRPLSAEAVPNVPPLPSESSCATLQTSASSALPVPLTLGAVSAPQDISEGRLPPPEDQSSAIPPTVQAATSSAALENPAPNLASSVFPPISPEAPKNEVPNGSDLEGFLALFTDISADDLDALFATPDLPDATTNDTTTSSDAAMSLHKDNQSSSSSAPFDLSLPSPSDVPGIDSSLFAMDPSLLAIDPALLAISFPQATAASQTESAYGDAIPLSASDGSPTPTLAGSPASFAEDPLTPSWDFSFPEPEIANADGESGPEESVRADVITGFEHGRAAARVDKGKGRATEDLQMNTASHDDMSTATSVTRDEARTACDGNVSGTQAHVPMIQGRAPIMAPPQFVVPHPQDRIRLAVPRHLPPYGLSPYAPSSLVRPTLGGKSSSSLAGKNREEILRRARAMRAQIVEEIERAKVELWETTMENGCLTVLAKERDKLA